MGRLSPRRVLPGWSTWRDRAAIAVASTAVLVGLLAAPVFGAWVTAPAAIAAGGAAAVVIAGSAAHSVLARIAGAAGVASLAVTVGAVLAGAAYPSDDRAVTAWVLTETAGLFLLTLQVVRVAPRRSATVAATLTGIAMPSWLLRIGGGVVTAAVLGGFAVWGLVALLAVTIGLYLRALDDRRGRSVAEARRAQRDQLARDLHDFVAHDISGMLAQAQAGQIIADRDPAAAKAAFRRIEQSGMKALAALDQTVYMLYGHPSDRADRRLSPPTLIDLPDVVARFAATGPATGHLEMDPNLDVEQLPREITTTAYRLVVEGLTNVRRHAPNAGRVTVTVRRTTPTPGLDVIVSDDGGAPHPAALGPIERHGGLGLPGLTERVEALGGTLTAGPADPTGWRVAAFLPLPPHGRSRHG